MNTAFQQLRFTPSLGAQFQPPPKKQRRVSSPCQQPQAAQDESSSAEVKQERFGFKPFYPTKPDSSFSGRRASANIDREEMAKIKTLVSSANAPSLSDADDAKTASKPSFTPFQQLHLSGQLHSQSKPPIPETQPKSTKSMAGPNMLNTLNLPMATLHSQSESLNSPKQAKAKQKKQLVFNSKQEMIRYIENFRINYKTEICRNWKTSQQCEFGVECAYAHGYDELQQKLPAFHKNYKTKMCKNWHENTPGECNYGDKCQFIHDEPAFTLELEDEPKSPSGLLSGASSNLQQISQLRLKQLPSVHPLQTLSAFNQCYFSSHPNKKAVEKAVYSQAFQNQIKDYTMMNLTRHARPRSEEASDHSDSVLDDERSSFTFNLFKPLDLYWHRQGEQHETTEGGDSSSSCNLSESDFRSIEKNLENEILNQSIEDLSSPEAEESEAEEVVDTHEANSIGTQILTRKRLRVFDEITNEASSESPEARKGPQQSSNSGFSFGLKLEVCEDGSA